jgi:hypothetical protein
MSNLKTLVFCEKFLKAWQDIPGMLIFKWPLAEFEDAQLFA